jgi:23S rRNA (uracil1939-C5)-methyltransferase
MGDSVFENDKANRELILDHLYEKFTNYFLCIYVNNKANDTFYTTQTLNYIKDAITS